MSLVDHYRNQRAWRDWRQVLAELPSLGGARVLDLGCGIGDQAEVLCGLGAKVLGVDANATVIDAARARRIAGAEFVVGDLRNLPVPEQPFDGLWASFTAAYFPDLGPVLASWQQRLRPGGFVVLVEIDDLFAHRPVAKRTNELLERYVDEALVAGRYDFRMGRKLSGHLERLGFVQRRCHELPDREFAFAGAASTEVLQAWRERWELMRLLRVQFGTEYEAARDDFLGCLGDARHESLARVLACIATQSG